MTEDTENTTPEERLDAANAELNRVPGLKKHAAFITAAAMIDKIAADKKEGERQLAGMWAACAEFITEHLDIKDARLEFLVAVMVISEYFSHRGDWEAMKKCCTDAGEAVRAEHNLPAGLVQVLKVKNG